MFWVYFQVSVSVMVREQTLILHQLLQPMPERTRSKASSTRLRIASVSMPRTSWMGLQKNYLVTAITSSSGLKPSETSHSKSLRPKKSWTTILVMKRSVMTLITKRFALDLQFMKMRTRISMNLSFSSMTCGLDGSDPSPIRSQRFGTHMSTHLRSTNSLCTLRMVSLISKTGWPILSLSARLVLKRLQSWAWRYLRGCLRILRTISLVF